MKHGNGRLSILTIGWRGGREGRICTGKVIQRVRVKKKTARDGTREKRRQKKRERVREEKTVTVRGGRRRDTGGGEVECVNTQEHCIKPMHCSEAG